MDRTLTLVQAPTVLMVFYLDLLAVAALLWRPSVPLLPPKRRFAVLVPAHNEELLLPRLLQSIAGLEYPPHLFDVHVVADNCTDRTAAIACAAKVTLYERFDLDLRGKGYALRWLFDQLADRPQDYDAFVILDADSTISPNFLAVLNSYLARGDQVIQSCYGVLNRQESWPAMLRHVAFVLFNDLRPRGRAVLRLSAGLRGNGMCFTAKIIERFGWEAFTLAEDAEFHLQLVSAGVHVNYAPEAVVLAEMPSTLRQSGSQNVRWERGRLQLLHKYGPRLLMEGLSKGDAARLDALAEQLVPPLSVLSAATTLTALLTAALRVRKARQVAIGALLGQVGYVFAGLFLVRAGLRVFAALLFAPLYVAWKVWVYLLAAVGIRKTRWIRTARQPLSDLGGSR